jgi:hypothetical protein
LHQDEKPLPENALILPFHEFGRPLISARIRPHLAKERDLPFEGCVGEDGIFFAQLQRAPGRRRPCLLTCRERQPIVEIDNRREAEAAALQ